MSRGRNALMRGARAVFAVAAFAILSACVTQPPARPTTQVVLLPQADGKPSAVVVTTSGGSSTLSTPYQRATVLPGAPSAPTVDATDAGQAQARFGALLGATPPPPQRFTLFFQTGGTQLTPDSREMMARVLEEIPRRSGAELLIVGHTDTQGSGPSNDELSLRRARDVRDMFVQRGVPATHIEAAGRGERELAVPTADNVNEPRNRRVEVLVR